jgi:hypothetical protein
MGQKFLSPTRGYWMYIGSTPENFVQIPGIAASRLCGYCTPNNAGDERSEMEEEDGMVFAALEEICGVQWALAPQGVLDVYAL